MTDALRYNSGKIDYMLIPVEAETAEAKVWMAGEQEYGRDNWKKLWGNNSLLVIMKSLERHVKAIKAGQLLDQKSGLPHAAHVRCNAAMIIYWMENTPDGRRLTELERASSEYAATNAAPATDQK